MLMLVVTIIIAAVVSGFAGNLAGSAAAKKTPSLNMDVKIINTGDWHGSGFFATVTSVSDPIPTKDLKIVTSWTGRVLRADNGIIVSMGAVCNPNNLYRTGQSLAGPVITEESTVLPFNGTSNINVLYDPTVSLDQVYTVPFGNGPGINGTESYDSTKRSFSLPGQQFGNYTLIQGTTMTAVPSGAVDTDSMGSGGQSNTHGGYIAGVYTQPSFNGVTTEICPYVYQSCPLDTCIDPTKAVLGKNWYNLLWGDTVNVKVIYTPTGSVIYNKDIPVTES
jgi:hypothetical protein